MASPFARFLLFFSLLLKLLEFVPKVSGQSVNVVTIAGVYSTNGGQNGAGTIATFTNPYGVALDPVGDAYVAELGGHRIRKVTTSQPFNSITVSTWAGTGTAGGSDSFRTSATINGPLDLTFLANGNLMFVEYSGNKVRQISASTGQLTTFAGSGAGTFADGQGVAASFNMPWGIVQDSSGNIIISDPGNHKIRTISSTGYVSTLAGSGSGAYANGQGASASFYSPARVTISSNNIYLTELDNRVIRKITLGGAVSWFSGIVSTTAQAAADGPASNARFARPAGIAVDSRGFFYVADNTGNKIRKITPNGDVSTIAGTGAAGGLDGLGSVATLNLPSGIAIDPIGNLYITDNGGHLVRKIVFCSASAVFDNALKICTCNAGYQMLTNRSCVACAAGTESSADKSSCISCSTGMYRNSSMTSCAYCPLGTEVSSDRSSCNSCSNGKYRATLVSDSCISCSIGQQSAADKQSCQTCPSGKYRPSTDYLTCVDCPLYATCNSTHITSCAAGYKISSNSIECDQCPVGSQSSGDSKSCVSCVSGTTFRSSLIQSSCQSCPLNSVCTTTGFTCDAGHEPTADGLGCSHCQEGDSKAASGNVACSQCPTGQESAADKLSCVACPAGFYRPNTLVNKCIPCPPNGMCSFTTLTKCQNGFKKNSAGTGCEQCPIGQDSSDGLNCLGCQAGYFKPDQSFDLCLQCPPGSSCGGSTVTCQIGHYFDTNAQCKRNDTYFALQQTGTQTASTVTSFVTLTQTQTQTSTTTSTTTSTSTTSVYQTATVTQNQYVTTGTNQQQQQTQTNTLTLTVSPVSSPVVGSQAQLANSVTIDFLNATLPISPLIFAAMAFGAGLFIMLILSLVCCRRSTQRRKDEEFDGMAGVTTTGLNTTSQRTFTNTSSMR